MIWQNGWRSELYIQAEAYKHFRELHIEPPTPERIDRLIRSAISSFEDKFFKETYQKIPRECLPKIDLLINNLTLYDENEINFNNGNESISFSELRADPGRIGLESVFKEIAKLRAICQLELPVDLFKNIPQKVLNRYKFRAVSRNFRNSAGILNSLDIRFWRLFSGLEAEK